MLRSQQYSIAMMRTIAPGGSTGLIRDAGYANIECPIAFKIASDRAI
jgi:hypothetical protein